MPPIVALAKPVFAAKWDGDRFWVQGLYGTALPLAHDLLLTADHVVANVLAVAPEFAVGWGAAGDKLETKRRVPLSRAVVAARWPEVDLAALRLPASIGKPLNWDMGIHPTLTPVASIGYPFGFDTGDNSVSSRGFAGNLGGHPKPAIRGHLKTGHRG